MKEWAEREEPECSGVQPSRCLNSLHPADRKTTAFHTIAVVVDVDAAGALTELEAEDPAAVLDQSVYPEIASNSNGEVHRRRSY